MILASKTEDARQLAAIYTAANVSFNPTREDNYPIVNLEDQTCETPIVTYETGGSKETLHSNTSRAMKDYQEGLSNLLQRVFVS